MNTSEVLDKYKKAISSILKCEPSDIKFYINNSKTEIKSVHYHKLDWCLGYYKVIQQIGNTQKIISTWSLYQLPHCCAFMVSTNVVVAIDYRNKKIGTILNQLRQDIGKLLNFSAILCTDIDQNIYQKKILETNGWKNIHSLVNKRTNNKVHLSVIDI